MAQSLPNFLRKRRASRSSPSSASEFAPQYDLLYYFLTAVTVFFTALIFGLIIYFCIKYRRKENDQPTPTFESTRLEIFYTVVPFIIVMVMFFWGAGLYFNVFTDAEDPLNVHVIGKQWMWKVQHMEGRREINELHVPVGRKVQLTMGSQDVIHSFFIPAFRVKQDVVPGRYTTMTFTPTKAGVYHLFCAEYCGAQHSGMVGRVVVMEQDEYKAWLTGSDARTTSPPPKPGGSCSPASAASPATPCRPRRWRACYGRQQEVVLPNGQTKLVTVDEKYLRESITNSTATDREGLPADHAQLPPAVDDHRGTDQPIGRVHPLPAQRQAGPRRRRGAAEARPAAAEPAAATARRRPGTGHPPRRRPRRQPDAAGLEARQRRANVRSATDN